MPASVTTSRARTGTSSRPTTATVCWSPAGRSTRSRPDGALRPPGRQRLRPGSSGRQSKRRRPPASRSQHRTPRLRLPFLAQVALGTVAWPTRAPRLSAAALCLGRSTRSNWAFGYCLVSSHAARLSRRAQLLLLLPLVTMASSPGREWWWTRPVCTYGSLTVGSTERRSTPCAPLGPARVISRPRSSSAAVW